MLAQFGSSLGIAAHYTVLNGRFVAGEPAYGQALHTLTESLAQQGAAQP